MKIANIEQGTDEGEETSSFEIPCSVFDILPAFSHAYGIDNGQL